jgi:hypothetical protein
LTKLPAALLLSLGLITSCSSSEAKGADCGDARAVAKKHKAAAEVAAASAAVPPVDPNDPNAAPVPDDDPAAALIKGLANLDTSSTGTTEARLYFATVNGNPSCFGAEERAQVAVLSARLSAGQ